MDAIRTNYELKLEKTDGAISVHHTSKKRRLFYFLTRDVWNRAHLRVSYRNQNGKKLADNRCMCTSYEDAKAALSQFEEPELIDFLVAQDRTN